jgi:hypothetical protein
MKPQPSSTDHVDLKAVLNRVQALFRENEELTGLLVGEMRSTGDDTVGMGSWLGVINGETRWMGWARAVGYDEEEELIRQFNVLALAIESKEMITALE